MKSLRDIWRSAVSGLLMMVPGMLTCAEADSFIDDYLDGELSDAQSRAFDRHLRLCRPCRSYLESYRRTVALSKCYGGDTEGPRPKMPKELIQAILSSRSETD